MESLEVRIVTPAERRERLRRLSGIIAPEQMPDIIEIASKFPSISNEQMEETHEIFFKGGFTRIETIQRAVLVEFQGVSMADLKSRRRTANVVKPRQIAMYISKEMTNQSLPDIGRRFGGRDHTTVLHAVKKIGSMVAADCYFAAMIKRVMARVEGAR